MKIYGLTTNPLEFCIWIRENNIKISFNIVEYFRNIILFDSVYNALMQKDKLTNQIVIIFDNEEKLKTVENITIVNAATLAEFKLFLKLKGSKVEAKNAPKIELNAVDVDFVRKTIEESKLNSGIMHKYNTLVFKISQKDLREQLLEVIYSYVSGNLSYEQISAIIEEIRQLRRNESTKDNVKNLMELVQSVEFGNIRKVLMQIFARKDQITNDEVEKIALEHKVEPYDARYLYNVITKKRKG